MLAGAWRTVPSPNHLYEKDLERISPLLHAAGAAALSWWQIRHSELRASPLALELERAYVIQSLYSSLHEQRIMKALELLRAGNVEPILVKGWAIARLYPEAGLRPYGDIDLCVRSEHLALAKDALRDLEAQEHYIDLHKEFNTLDDRSWDELFERSHIAHIDNVKVRIPAPEDHLRILCLHMLRHGAWRPLWLCDVAVAVEARPANFDWELCLGENPRRAQWITCTAALAHHLLNANIEGTPAEDVEKHLPRWLVPAVIRQWDRCRDGNAHEMALPALLNRLRTPGKLWEEIYPRWDHPIRASFELNAPINNWPRFPFQLGALLMRSSEVPRQLVKMLRQR